MYNQMKESSNELQHVIQEDVEMDPNAKEKLESMMQEDADMDREAKDSVGAAMNFGYPNNRCDVEEGWKYVPMDNGDAQADGPGDMIYIVLSIIGVFAACFMIMKSYGYLDNRSENEGAGYLDGSSENEDAVSLNDSEAGYSPLDSHLCNEYRKCHHHRIYKNNPKYKDPEFTSVNSQLNRSTIEHPMHKPYLGKNLFVGQYCYETDEEEWYFPRDKAVHCAKICLDMNIHSATKVQNICKVGPPPICTPYYKCDSECWYKNTKGRPSNYKHIIIYDINGGTGPCNEKSDKSKLWYCPKNKFDHCNNVCRRARDKKQDSPNYFWNC